MSRSLTSGLIDDGSTVESSGWMTWTRWAIVGGAIAMAFLVWVGVDWDRGGSGDGVDGTVQSISQSIQDTSSTVRDRLVDARTSMRNMGLGQQVATRLGQDKTINADKIEVLVENESTVILSGLVPDRKDKDKAVTLARDTRGVEQVVDQLAVPPPARVIVAAPAVDETPAVATRTYSQH